MSKHRRPVVFLFLTRKEETNFSQHSQEQSKRLQRLVRERAPEERTAECRSKNEDKTQLKSLFGNITRPLRLYQWSLLKQITSE